MPKRLKVPEQTASIAQRIHTVRGQKVMLDANLAALYHVQTSNLNKAVKRNLRRFPEHFMFRLTTEEASNLTFQVGISSWGGRRTLPYVFTEHGVVMLSAVLNSVRAEQVSILVVETFIRLREAIAASKDIAARVEKLERGHDRTASVIEVLVEDIDRCAREVSQMKALPASRRRKIGFDL